MYGICPHACLIFMVINRQIYQSHGCSHGPTSMKKAGHFGGPRAIHNALRLLSNPKFDGHPVHRVKVRRVVAILVPGWHVAIWSKTVKPNWKWSRFFAKWIPFPLWSSSLKRFTTRCLKLSVHFQTSEDVSC